MRSDANARALSFDSGGIYTQNDNSRNYGFALRYLAQSEPPEIRVLLLGPYSLCVEEAILALCMTQVILDTIGLALFTPKLMAVVWVLITTAFMCRLFMTGSTVFLSAT